MRVFKVILGVAALIACASVTFWVWTHGMEDHEPDPAEHATGADEKAKEPRVSLSDAGEIVIALSQEEREHLALEVQPVEATTWQPHTTAYGVLLEDPSRTFVLRAPATGILHSSIDAWPQVGNSLPDNLEVGYVEPQWSPTPLDLVDRATRLAEARGAVADQQVAVNVSKAAYERLKALNEQDRNVSDRAVEEALGKLKSDEAKLATAQALVTLLDKPIDPNTVSLPPVTLKIIKGGEVIEALAQPGEAVDVGRPILRVARFDRMLARVHLLLGDTYEQKPGGIQVSVVGQEDHPLDAELISKTQMSDSRSLGPTLLLAITTQGLSLEPGRAVIAQLPAAGESLQGVSIDRASIIRYLGQSWVYVQTSENHFARRLVPLNRQISGGWFSVALKPGDKVVTVGAASLLSTELLAQYHIEEEE